LGKRSTRRINPASFLPHEIVCRQRDLKDGPKLLYWRMKEWAGANGSCWYGFEKMAEELGKSERQVRYDVEALEKYKLIGHRVRGWKDGKRQTNVYFFLRHPIFDSKVDGNPLPGNRKGNLQEESSSEKLEAAACSVERKPPVDDEVVDQEKPTDPEPEPPTPWARVEDIAVCQKALGEIRGKGDRPDQVITWRILCKLHSREAYHEWIADHEAAHAAGKDHRTIRDLRHRCMGLHPTAPGTASPGAGSQGRGGTPAEYPDETGGGHRSGQEAPVLRPARITGPPYPPRDASFSESGMRHDQEDLPVLPGIRNHRQQDQAHPRLLLMWCRR
jgi:hypothetical protein